MYVCVCHMCMGDYRSQKRVFHYLELELQVVLSFLLWLSGITLRSSGRAIRALNCRVISPAQRSSYSSSSSSFTFSFFFCFLLLLLFFLLSSFFFHAEDQTQNLTNNRQALYYRVTPPDLLLLFKIIIFFIVYVGWCVCMCAMVYSWNVREQLAAIVSLLLLPGL